MKEALEKHEKFDGKKRILSINKKKNRLWDVLKHWHFVYFGFTKREGGPPKTIVIKIAGTLKDIFFGENVARKREETKRKSQIRTVGRGELARPS